jgi:ACS family hexuronate transporter-like MFS transporter
MGVTIVNYLDRTCLAVAAPTLKKELAIDEIDFSHIVAAFQLAYLVMQPFAGRIIDWLNLRVGLALSIAWWSLAQMLAALSGGWHLFAALRALLAVGEAANFPAAAKAVSIWFRPAERTMAMGILNVGAGLGGVIAPPLVVYLVLTFGWQSAFVVTGAIGLVWVAVWLVLYRSPDEHPWMTAGERAFIREGQQASDVESRSAAQAPPSGVWVAVLSDRNFWGIALARFLSEPAWQFFTYWIPLYLATERHMQLKAIAYFAWLPFLAGDLGCIVGGALSPLFVRLGASMMRARKLAACVCALIMVGAAGIGRAPTAEWAIVFFCVGAFAHQAMSSTLLTLPADLFPQGRVATANGLSGSVGMLGGTLFTMIVGVVAMRVGYAPLFLVIGSLDMVGAALLWALVREVPARP